MTLDILNILYITTKQYVEWGGGEEKRKISVREERWRWIGREK